MTANQRSMSCGCLVMSAFLIPIFLFSVLMNAEHYLYQIPFHLAFGWIRHGYLALSNLTTDGLWLVKLFSWMALATVALFGVSRFVRPLRFRQSLALMVASIAFFASASAVVAMAYKFGSLGQVKMVENTQIGRISKSINNARQLALACQLYAGDANGEYPPTLDALLEANILTDLEKLRNTIQPDDTRIPFTYLPGLSTGDPGDLPVIVSPGPMSTGKYIVAKNDGSVTLESEESYRRFMKAYRDHLVSKAVSSSQAQRVPAQ